MRPVLIFSALKLKFMMKKNRKRNLLIILLAFVLLLGGIIGCWGYRIVYSENFMPDKTFYLYINNDRNFDALCQTLQDSAASKHINNFRMLARWIDYPQNMRTGRYAVKPGMNNLELLNALRRGHQVPTRITFNNIRFKEDLAKRLDEQLMFSSDELLTLLNDSVYCDSLGFTPQTIMAMFIPNTYEVYWNIPVENFVGRMKREYDSFWNEERRQKAADIGLTPIEVATLASIVEEETAAADEYPIVAGLYINRLKRGILLQADPTVKFAMGDFGLQRILYEHLEIDSPYNTYKYAGLPPGPLRVPTIKGMDAVLNHMKHNYLYMCAKEDFSGRHNFAVTLAEHSRNANRYRAELNRRKIR